jgi:hypothetical protein
VNSHLVLCKEEKRIAVEVVRAVRGDIASFINTTGTVYARQEAYLSPKIGGKIEKIFVDEATMMKRFRPRSRGRVSPILKRSSHITVVVAGQES